MDRPPPATDERSAYLQLGEAVGSILIEATATHVVTEIFLSSSGIPPYIMLPALLLIGVGIHWIVRRQRQRKPTR
jgi:hypothetical protein